MKRINHAGEVESSDVVVQPPQQRHQQQLQPEPPSITNTSHNSPAIPTFSSTLSLTSTSTSNTIMNNNQAPSKKKPPAAEAISPPTSASASTPTAEPTTASTSTSTSATTTSTTAQARAHRASRRQRQQQQRDDDDAKAKAKASSRSYTHGFPQSRASTASTSAFTTASNTTAFTESATYPTGAASFASGRGSAATTASQVASRIALEAQKGASMSSTMSQSATQPSSPRAIPAVHQGGKQAPPMRTPSVGMYYKDTGSDFLLSVREDSSRHLPMRSNSSSFATTNADCKFSSELLQEQTQSAAVSNEAAFHDPALRSPPDASAQTEELLDMAAEADLRPGAYYARNNAMLHSDAAMEQGLVEVDDEFVYDAKTSSTAISNTSSSRSEEMIEDAAVQHVVSDSVLTGYVVGSGKAQRDPESQEQIMIEPTMVVRCDAPEKEPSFCNRHRIMIIGLIAIVCIVAVAVAVTTLLSTSDDGTKSIVRPPRANETASPTASPTAVATQAPTSSGMPPDLSFAATIATVPSTLCNERVPGSGYSDLCPVNQTSQHGGDVATLVASSIRRAMNVDIVLQNAAAVDSDIRAGNLSVADTLLIIPIPNDIIIIPNATGQEIVSILESNLDKTFATAACSCLYPYTAGMRFDVNSTERQGQRLSNVEVRADGGEYVAINLDATYSLAIHYANPVDGRDGYLSYLEVPDVDNAITEDRMIVTDRTALQIFRDYAWNQQVLRPLEDEHYSTQSFV